MAETVTIEGKQYLKRNPLGVLGQTGGDQSRKRGRIVHRGTIGPGPPLPLVTGFTRPSEP